jgi:hypothetical protein
MPKTPEMEAMLDQIAADFFGGTRTEAFKKGICVICGGDATMFRDPVSAREYQISAMCQGCQDDVFNNQDNNYSRGEL